MKRKRVKCNIHHFSVPTFITSLLIVNHGCERRRRREPIGAVSEIETVTIENQRWFGTTRTPRRFRRLTGTISFRPERYLSDPNRLFWNGRSLAICCIKTSTRSLEKVRSLVIYSFQLYHVRSSLILGEISRNFCKLIV